MNTTQTMIHAAIGWHIAVFHGECRVFRRGESGPELVTTQATIGKYDDYNATILLMKTIISHGGESFLQKLEAAMAEAKTFNQNPK